jgi:tetratricopeptide (TPR) repeat protein
MTCAAVTECRESGLSKGRTARTRREAVAELTMIAKRTLPTAFALFLALLAAGAFRAAPAQTAPGALADADSLLGEASDEIKRGRYDLAVESLRRAIALRPDAPQAQLDLSFAYIKLGRFALAVEPARAAIRLRPGEVKAYLNLGMAYEFMQRFPEALDAYHQAIAVDPNSAIAYNSLAAMYHRTGRIEEAIKYYREAVRLDPSFAAAHTNLGLAYIRLGKYDEGIEAFRRAISLNPDAVKAHHFLAGTYLRKGMYEKAIDSYGEEIRLTPKNPNTYRERALANLYLARGGAAAADARAFLDMAGWRDGGSQYMAVVAHLGLRQAGGGDGAQRVLDEAALNADTSAWPYPLLRYLRRELSEREALAAADNIDKLTEAHAYIGMDMSLSGKTEEAVEHFKWVKEYGNRSFVEYPLALGELKRLAGGDAK